MGQDGKHVAIIGAGLEGISAAISLAQMGYRFSMYEKNEKIEGKLNFLSGQGYSFDLGLRYSPFPISSKGSSSAPERMCPITLR